MLRFFKPDRGRGIHQRGYFSYITEAVGNIQNVLLSYPDQELKIYYGCRMTSKYVSIEFDFFAHVFKLVMVSMSQSS